MSHYEARLQQDLENIQREIEAIAAKVETALRNAVHALVTGNRKLAYATILHDGPINRAVRALDRSCHSFIAIHLPSASHLRLISSALRVGIELERIGDYAVTISREAVQLSAPPESQVARELESMAETARGMYLQATSAFQERDAATARATMGIAKQIEHSFDALLPTLMADKRYGQVKDLLATFVAFNMLGRVADQSKNICEETVFAATGAQKTAKRYQVLFLESADNRYGPMATAIARKAYPESGEYVSAGEQPAASLESGIRAFMLGHGLDVGEYRPQKLQLTPLELAEFHVVVSVDGPIERHLQEIPFHTVSLEWDLPPADSSDSPDQSHRALEEAYRELAVQIRDLMHLLRGPEAR